MKCNCPMVILHFKKVSICDDFLLIVSAECYSRTEHLTCFEKNEKKCFAAVYSAA